MTNTEAISLILQMVQDTMTYMVPIIAVLGGITLVITWFTNVVFGISRNANFK